MEAQSVVPLLREGTAPSTCPTDALPCPPPGQANLRPSVVLTSVCTWSLASSTCSLSRGKGPHFPYGWGSVSLSHGGLSGRDLRSSCFTRLHHPLVFSGATLSSWLVCQLA